MSGILVTGATGTVGAAVAEHLAAAGEQVFAAVRPGSPSAVAAGIVPRPFDFGQPRGWPAAFEGIDRLFLMRPPAIADVASTLIPVVDAAVARGIRHVVFLSLQGVQVNRRVPHYAVEQHLRRSRIPFTFLRPNFFMQNLSTVYRDGIRDRDEIFLPAARARTAFVDARDIGRVAVPVFRGGEHLGRAYTLSGERALDYDEVAELLGAELARPIRYARPSTADYARRLRDEGAAEDYIAVQRMLYRIVRWGLSSRPNTEIRRLTGIPATTFARFAHDYRAAWMPDPARR